VQVQEEMLEILWQQGYIQMEKLPLLTLYCEVSTGSSKKMTMLSYNSEMVCSNLQLLLLGASCFLHIPYYLGRTAG